jgi:hypothetical protein
MARGSGDLLRRQLGRSGPLQLPPHLPTLRPARSQDRSSAQCVGPHHLPFDPHPAMVSGNQGSTMVDCAALNPSTEEKYIVCHVESSASEVFVLDLCTCTMSSRFSKTQTSSPWSSEQYTCYKPSKTLTLFAFCRSETSLSSMRTLPCCRYFPFQTAAACAIGCASAIVALVLPYPRVASAEAKARVATAAKVSAATFSSLVESYTALSVSTATPRVNTPFSVSKHAQPCHEEMGPICIPVQLMSRCSPLDLKVFFQKG